MLDTRPWLGLGVRVGARVRVKVSLAPPARAPACSTRGRPCSSSALASLTRILRRLFSYCCALLAMQVGPHYVLRHGCFAKLSAFNSCALSWRSPRQLGSEGYAHPSLRSPRASVRLTRRAAPGPELTLSGRPRCPLLVEQRHHCSRSVRDVLLASEVAMRSCSRRGGSWASQVDTTRQASKSSKILPILATPEPRRARAEAPAQGQLASA